MTENAKPHPRDGSGSNAYGEAQRKITHYFSCYKNPTKSFNAPNSEIVSHEAKPDGFTNGPETTKTKKQTRSDSIDMKSKTSTNKKKVRLNQSNEKITSITIKKILKNAEINKSEKQKRKTASNRFKNKNFVDDKQKKITDYQSFFNRKPSILTKTYNESNSENVNDESSSRKDLTNKTNSHIDRPNDERPSTSSEISNKSNDKSRPREKLSYKTETTKIKRQSTLDSKALPAVETRFAMKNAAFIEKLKVVRSHSPITKLDWYYKDKDYYEKNCDDALKFFAIRKEERREGNYRRSYTYLLFDPRIFEGSSNISWLNFIDAIFYIGKGTGKRAFQHAKDSENALTEKEKCVRINNIWDSGKPVKVFFAKEKITAEEAYTREAAMIDAMGLERLCNEQRGTYYDEVKKFDAKTCYEMGVTLLIEALEIFKRNNEEDMQDVYREKKPPVV